MSFFWRSQVKGSTCSFTIAALARSPKRMPSLLGSIWFMVLMYPQNASDLVDALLRCFASSTKHLPFAPAEERPQEPERKEPEQEKVEKQVKQLLAKDKGNQSKLILTNRNINKKHGAAVLFKWVLIKDFKKTHSLTGKGS